MDSISNSLRRRSFTSNSNVAAVDSHKLVYDGVFAGHRNLGQPALIPRLEDYSDIFSGFHASQSLSIPVLDLTVSVDDPGLVHFGGCPNYAEIFGDSGSSAFAATFQDLIRDSIGGNDSSVEPGSPAQSGSMSDEFSGLVESDKSLRYSDDDAQQSMETPTEQLYAFQNKSSQSNTETVLVGKRHVASFTALPGYTPTHYESPITCDGEDESCSGSVVDDVNLDGCKEYKKRVTDEKQYTMFPVSSVHCGSSAQINNFNLSEEHGNSASKAFLSVSDISLRTKPSRLPPPSRPPPALVVKIGDHERLGSKVKASQTASFTFDVEADVTLSSDGGEDGNKNVNAKHERAKESLERKDIRGQSAMTAKEETSKTATVNSNIMDEELLKSQGKETKVSIPVIEEKMESIRGIEDISGSYSNSSSRSSAGGVAWREEPDYFEVIEKKFKVSRKDQGLEEERLQHEVTSEQQNILKSMLSDQKGFREELESNIMVNQCDSHKAVPEIFQQRRDRERRQTDHTETVEVLQEAEGNLSEVVIETKSNVYPKGMDIEKMFIINAKLMKQNSVRQGRLDVVEQTNIKGRVKARIGPEGTNIAFEKGDEDKPRKAHEPNENEMIFEVAKKYEEHDKQSSRVAGLGNFEDQHLTCGDEKDGLTYRDTFYQDRDEKEEKMGLKIEIIEERNEDASRGHITEGLQMKGHTNLATAGAQGLSGHTEDMVAVKRNEHERVVEWDMHSHIVVEKDQLKAFDCGRKLDEAVATSGLGKFDKGIRQLKAEPSYSTYEAVPGVENPSVDGKSNGFGKSKNEFDGGSTNCAVNTTLESSILPKKVAELNVCGYGMGNPHVMTDNMSSDFAYGHEPEKVVSTEDDRVLPSKGTQFISKGVDIRDSFSPYPVVREFTTIGRKVEDASSVMKHNGDTFFSLKNNTSQRIERKGYIMKGKIDSKDQKTGERIRRDIELENEHIRRLEEERERERERAKDRMAVNKTALESRERSYAEFHERAERAAMDRATAEVRERAMAGARQRLEKVSSETKLWDERAAIERATAEARQRAAEKSMASKIVSQGHVHVERSVPYRFPTSFRSADMRQNSLASDIRSESTRISNSFQYSYSFPRIGADGESPQRCKARLERYRRTAERAANALAEKNRRDLLAQKEKEEMTKVAETLDIEVKRWASGKEGNLRALLSTLQYILGPDSGWQPVPLTEVITSAAVKKAYRKATLCVHPDKLQQRGATIQQKYICEKVFDLLKESWSKFNSEER